MTLVRFDALDRVPGDDSREAGIRDNEEDRWWISAARHNRGGPVASECGRDLGTVILD